MSHIPYLYYEELLIQSDGHSQWPLIVGRVAYGLYYDACGVFVH